MKKIIVTIVFGAAFIIAGYFLSTKLSSQINFWNERVVSALAPSQCPSVAEKKFQNSYYQGPLIDTHIHIGPIPDGPFTGDTSDSVTPSLGVNVTVHDMVCMLDHGGIKKAFVFFPVYPPITDAMIGVVQKTMDIYPDRIVPFIMPPDRDNDPGGYPTVDATLLQEMLAAKPGLFKGYGEIGLYGRRGGAAELPPDSQRLQEIYPVIRSNNLVVYFHLGEGQQESFERMLAANPDINFIFHGDQLIKYENGIQNLRAVEEILNNHPNAYYGVDELYGDVWLIRPEVSKEEFLAHFKDYKPLLQKDLATWKGFIERHPNQVIWGTDRGATALWSIDSVVSQTLTSYGRAFIGRLDKSVQERFAYQNAERLTVN